MKNNSSDRQDQRKPQGFHRGHDGAHKASSEPSSRKPLDSQRTSNEPSSRRPLDSHKKFQERGSSKASSIPQEPPKKKPASTLNPAEKSKASSFKRPGSPKRQHEGKREAMQCEPPLKKRTRRDSSPEDAVVNMEVNVMGGSLVLSCKRNLVPEEGEILELDVTGGSLSLIIKSAPTAPEHKREHPSKKQRTSGPNKDKKDVELSKALVLPNPSDSKGYCAPSVSALTSGSEQAHETDQAKAVKDIVGRRALTSMKAVESPESDPSTPPGYHDYPN